MSLSFEEAKKVIPVILYSNDHLMPGANPKHIRKQIVRYSANVKQGIDPNELHSSLKTHFEDANDRNKKVPAILLNEDGSNTGILLGSDYGLYKVQLPTKRKNDYSAISSEEDCPVIFTHGMIKFRSGKNRQFSEFSDSNLYFLGARVLRLQFNNLSYNNRGIPYSDLMIIIPEGQAHSESRVLSEFTKFFITKREDLGETLVKAFLPPELANYFLPHVSKFPLVKLAQDWHTNYKFNFRIIKK